MSRLRSHQSQRIAIYQTILSSGLVPIFSNSDPETACQISDAIEAGGSPVIELTNRGPRALQIFTRMIEHQRNRGSALITGAGTILDASTAALFISAGAQFIVSPSLDRGIAELCNRRKIPYIPGCATPTEIAMAHAFGMEIIKIFPAGELGGPAFIKNILGPMPWSCLMATGGVKAEKENLRQWLAAGAACVGMGSNLIREQWLTTCNFDLIASEVSQVLGWIQEIRSDLTAAQATDSHR